MKKLPLVFGFIAAGMGVAYFCVTDVAQMPTLVQRMAFWTVRNLNGGHGGIHPVAVMGAGCAIIGVLLGLGLSIGRQAEPKMMRSPGSTHSGRSRRS